jgi:hypothetical protein
MAQGELTTKVNVFVCLNIKNGLVDFYPTKAFCPLGKE